MERLIRSLHLLWRAESLIVSFKLQRASQRAALLVGAGAAGVFALAMLNVAGFVWLRSIAGEVPAALLMAAADLGLGALAVILARGVGTGPDLETALETRRAALTELEAELAALEAELRGVRDELVSMKTAVTSFLHHPLESPLLAMILPLVKALTKSHHREKE